jgi:hypothetical protein
MTLGAAGAGVISPSALSADIAGQADSAKIPAPKRRTLQKLTIVTKRNRIFPNC